MKLYMLKRKDLQGRVYWNTFSNMTDVNRNVRDNEDVYIAEPKIAGKIKYKLIKE